MPASALWGLAARWMLVPAAVGATFVVLYVGLFVFILGPFPKDLVDPTAGLLLGAGVTAAGALTAPRHQTLVAIALGVAAIVLGFKASFAVAGVTAGTLIAVALVAWKGSRLRTPWSTRVVKRAAWMAAFAFVSLIGARYVDAPAIADAVPSELGEYLLSDAPGLRAVYQYDLGGFIDHEWLWRIDAKPEHIARVVAGLRLSPVTSVPPVFWAHAALLLAPRAPVRFRGLQQHAISFRRPGT